ncbi:hypothetical protein ALO48_200172 [Pseudomonas syringae pv. rhaphiolepidis]|nr:hypothetical protein ALO48_200172 [Pseudomonas syringae pv. rhaphiolepidis]
MHYSNDTHSVGYIAGKFVRGMYQQARELCLSNQNSSLLSHRHRDRTSSPSADFAELSRTPAFARTGICMETWYRQNVHVTLTPDEKSSESDIDTDDNDQSAPPESPVVPSREESFVSVAALAALEFRRKGSLDSLI